METCVLVKRPMPMRPKTLWQGEGGQQSKTPAAQEHLESLDLFDALDKRVESILRCARAFLNECSEMS